VPPASGGTCGAQSPRLARAQLARPVGLVVLARAARSSG
jgi:hypothetical protein